MIVPDRLDGIRGTKIFPPRTCESSCNYNVIFFSCSDSANLSRGSKLDRNVSPDVESSNLVEEACKLLALH